MGTFWNYTSAISKLYFWDTFRHQNDNAVFHSARTAIAFLTTGHHQDGAASELADYNPIESGWDEFGQPIAKMNNICRISVIC